jgi:hypothetical protein
MTYTYCCVYSARLLMMDRKPVRNIEFYSKNKFEKLVHLVGFIIRIYHDARSSECQIQECTYHGGQVARVTKFFTLVRNICVTFFMSYAGS